jgi:hypothetical protein
MNPLHSVENTSLVEDASVAPQIADPEDNLQIYVTKKDGNIIRATHMNPFDSASLKDLSDSQEKLQI